MSNTPALSVALTTPAHFGLYASTREAEEHLAALTGLDGEMQALTLHALRSRGPLRERAESLLRAYVGPYDIRQTDIPVVYLSESCDNPLSRR